MIGRKKLNYPNLKRIISKRVCLKWSKYNFLLKYWIENHQTWKFFHYFYVEEGWKKREREREEIRFKFNRQDIEFDTLYLHKIISLKTLWYVKSWTQQIKMCIVLESCHIYSLKFLVYAFLICHHICLLKSHTVFYSKILIFHHNFHSFIQNSFNNSSLPFYNRTTKSLTQ